MASLAFSRGSCCASRLTGRKKSCFSAGRSGLYSALCRCSFGGLPRMIPCCTLLLLRGRPHRSGNPYAFTQLTTGSNRHHALAAHPCFNRSFQPTRRIHRIVRPHGRPSMHTKRSMHGVRSRAHTLVNRACLFASLHDVRTKVPVLPRTPVLYHAH
jgi:hypothetical protein